MIFFDKFPLQKGGYFKIVLNTHMPSTSTITYDATAKITAVVNTMPSQQIPFQVSPLTLTSGTGLVVAAGAGILVAKIGIVNSGGAGATNHPMTTCRFYGRVLDLAPSFESQYLSNPIKTVMYEDIITFNNNTLTNVAGGSPINALLTGSLAKLRKLYIFPFLSAGSSTSATTSPATGNGGFSPYASPFASEPATCSPYAWITNLQVFLSGNPLYPEPKTYRYLNFLEESHGGNSIDGALVNSLSSGLLSQHDYDTTYGVVVVDLSRHDVSQDDIAKSVSVSFNNGSVVTMDYICIISYARQLNVNIETGSLVL